MNSADINDDGPELAGVQATRTVDSFCPATVEAGELTCGTAVLFLVFNRPETTARVFAAIRTARPERLYLAADGPRADCGEDPARVEEVRQIISRIDWPCRVKRLFRTTNLGCKYGVSQAISWFFKHETEGIILEDDTLPGPRFFSFVSDGLSRFRNDSRVGAVCGYNIMGNSRRKKPFLSTYPHIWGWGTWRRVWSGYQVDMNFSRPAFYRVFNSHLKHRRDAYGLARIGRLLGRGKFNSWDFQLGYLLCARRLLSLYPPVNLVHNIGFGLNATHTLNGYSEPIGKTGAWDGTCGVPELDQEYDQCRFALEFPSLPTRLQKRLRGMAGLLSINLRNRLL